MPLLVRHLWEASLTAKAIAVAIAFGLAGTSLILMEVTCY
jgi:hypothetical protein